MQGWPEKLWFETVSHSRALRRSAAGKGGRACSHHNTQGGDLLSPRHTAQTGFHPSTCAVWTRAYLQLGPGEYESLLGDLRPWHDNAMSVTAIAIANTGSSWGLWGWELVNLEAPSQQPVWWIWQWPCLHTKFCSESFSVAGRSSQCAEFLKIWRGRAWRSLAWLRLSHSDVNRCIPSPNGLHGEFRDILLDKSHLDRTQCTYVFVSYCTFFILRRNIRVAV